MTHTLTHTLTGLVSTPNFHRDHGNLVSHNPYNGPGQLYHKPNNDSTGFKYLGALIWERNGLVETLPTKLHMWIFTGTITGTGLKFPGHIFAVHHCPLHSSD